ncbi:MAG: glycosidase [Phycisphaeraceae bacterium]
MAMFRRIKETPILGQDDMPFSCAAVYNPGATRQDGETVLLLRVEDRAGHSDIYVARSGDGVDDWRVEAEPLLRHGEPGLPYESWGVEDPRVTWFEDDACWYITYTASSSYGPTVALARTYDFQQVERLGMLLPPTNKDAVLLPSKHRGHYMMLHRPEYGDLEHIWSARSPDLMHWGEPWCLILERSGPAWDAHKVGSGPPPILTEKGWLLFFHGAKNYGNRLVYRVGVALLDRDQPGKQAQRYDRWLLQAEAPYEHQGLSPGVVFPSGLVHKGDELWLYYGAADSTVGLAVCDYHEVLSLFDT